MALRHAILSALSRGVPRTGYELNASFVEDIDRAWHASPSQVYAELTKLDKSGLIQVHERTERGRTSYVITAAGLAEIRRWLLHDDPDHSIRDDAMMRLVTMWVLENTNARYLIEAEIAAIRKRRMNLTHLLESWDADRENTRVWRNRRATYLLWHAQTDLMLTWLSGLLDVLEQPERTVPAIYADLGIESPHPSS